MTPTGSPPTSKQSRSRQSRGRPWVFVAAVLVVGAVAAQGLYGSLWSFGEDDSAQQSETMQVFAEQGPEGLLGLEPAPSDVSADAAVEAATKAVADASADAEASVQANVAEAEGELESLLSTHGGLPPLPDGYVAGTDAGAYVGAASPASFSVPDFDASVPIDLPAFNDWDSLPSQIPDPGSVLPQDAGGLGGATGSGGLDGLVGTIEETLGSNEVSNTLGTVQDTLGDDLPLPVPGDPGPSEVGDAERTLEPHEEGAEAAFDHAGRFLGTADEVYAGIEAEAGSIVAQHADLVSEVDAVIDSSGQLAAEGQEQVFTELEERTAAALDVHAASTAGLQATADEHLAEVQGTATALEADVRSHVDAQAAHVDGVVAEQQGHLLATAEAVQADADARVGDLLDQTEDLALEMQEHGASSEEIAALVAQARELRAGIEAQAEADTQLLLDASQDLQVQGDDAIAGLYGEADAYAAGAFEAADGAVAETEDRLAFALALVDAQRDRALESIESGAQVALESIEAQHQAHVDAVVGEALQVSQKTEAEIAFAMALVASVQEEADAEVGKDLDYILEVAEDYAAVPLPEREERADHWMGVHQDVLGGLGGTLMEGDDVNGQLEEALSLVQSNLVGIRGF